MYRKTSSAVVVVVFVAEGKMWKIILVVIKRIFCCYKNWHFYNFTIHYVHSTPILHIYLYIALYTQSELKEKIQRFFIYSQRMAYIQFSNFFIFPFSLVHCFTTIIDWVPPVEFKTFNAKMETHVLTLLFMLVHFL